MARRTLKPPLAVSIVALFVAIVGSLHLMSSATQDASRLGEIYSGLVVINALGSVLLLALVGANTYWLARQLRKKAAGSHLTARMIFLFSMLTLAPASIVFFYSMQFLERSIDSWFDVRIDQALDDALQLGQTALDERMGSLLRQTEQTAEELANSPISLVAVRLNELRDLSEDSEMTLFSRQGRILAHSSGQSGKIIPDLPEIGIMIQVHQGKPYVGLESTSGEGMQVRAVVSLAGDDALFLQAIYPVPVRMAELAGTVEAAYMHYKEMLFLRDSLKKTFTLTLSLVLLLSLLAAIWAAFLSIRRLVQPVRHLAIGTQAIAQGNYEPLLPVADRGELGFLVDSFNTMARKIAQARDEAQHSRQEVEQQHAYLETVLGNLSSGVLSFDRNMKLLTANPAAGEILHAGLGSFTGQPIDRIIKAYPHLQDLLSTLERHVRETTDPWQEEISFASPEAKQELFCRATSVLSPQAGWQGVVIVIDDVTTLIQAQRAAAWSEVARRLAHEIKNPLTPIQLSAERLRHKLAKTLTGGDLELLEKSTRTIVQQVEAMKTMVNAFAEYARPSSAQPRLLQLNQLIEEVITLYPPQSGMEFEFTADPDLPQVFADSVKLRQVLHNLIKNAQEAMAAGDSGKMAIATRVVGNPGQEQVEIRISDNGPGIPAEQANRIFEPYVTSKVKGTGLGLAIVLRILEEHGGTIRLDTRFRNGASFVIRLPIAARAITDEA